MNVDEKYCRLNVTAEHMQNAAAFDADDWPTMADDPWGRCASTELRSHTGSAQDVAENRSRAPTRSPATQVKDMNNR